MKINFTKSLMTLMIIAMAMTTINAQTDTLVYIWGGPNSTGTEHANSTFDGGLNDWTTEGIKSAVPDSAHNAKWAWSDSLYTRGAYNIQDVVTPTRENGYVVFDSDFLDNGGVQGQAAFGKGLAPAPQIGGLTSPALDFTGHPNVSILFYENFSHFSGRSVIQVSNDGGNSWVDYSIPKNDAVEVYTDEVTFVNMDITPTAGGQSNVRVRFLWTEPISPDAQNEGYYYWAVDDVAFIEPTAPNLAINSYVVPAAAYTQPTVTGVECDVMAFQVVLTNYTYSGVNDVPVKVEVVGPGGDVLFTREQNLALVSADPMTDTMKFDDTWAPVNVVGEYTVRYTVGNVGDADYSNNVVEDHFVVSENTFAGAGFSGYPFDNTKDIYAAGVRYFTCDYGAVDMEIKKVTYSVKAIGNQALDGEHAVLWIKKVLVDDSSWFPGSKQITSPDFLGKEDQWGNVATMDTILTAASDEVPLVIETFYDEYGDKLDHVMIEPSSNYIFAVATKGYTANPAHDPRKGIAIGFGKDINDYGGVSFLIVDEKSYGGWSGRGPVDITVEVGIVVDSKEPKLAENALVIVENPTRDELRLNLTFDKATDVGYAVASMDGTVSQSGSWKNVQDAKEVLDVSALASGQYLIRIQTKDGIATKSFIVVK